MQNVKIIRITTTKKRNVEREKARKSEREKERQRRKIARKNYVQQKKCIEHNDGMLYDWLSIA